MNKIVDNFGKNAGKIWKTLEKKGKLTPNKIMDYTKLNEDEFYAAVGWLARENKICRIGRSYTLGETNLENKIGKNAGKIWNALEKIGYVDEVYIPKVTDINTIDAYCALGWLAREGKISAKKIKPKTQTRFSVNKK